MRHGAPGEESTRTRVGDPQGWRSGKGTAVGPVSVAGLTGQSQLVAAVEEMVRAQVFEMSPVGVSASTGRDWTTTS